MLEKNPFFTAGNICLLKVVYLFLKSHGLTFTINLSKNLPTFKQMVYCLCFLLGMRKFSHFDINYFLVLLFAESMKNEKEPAPSLVKTLPQIGKSFLSITFLFLFLKTLNGGNKSGETTDCIFQLYSISSVILQYENFLI